MINTEKLQIQTIDLVAAAGCDLHCEYCVLQRTTNEHSHQLLKETKKALSDGTYLKNAIQGLYRLETSPNNIKVLNIWGQESTIVLKEFTEGLTGWIQSFPNLERIFFSTNGLGYFEDIYNFIIILDSLLTHNINLEIQFSYDGDFGTKNSRGGNGSIIKNNIIELIKKLNSVNLKYVKFNFYFHGVVSRQIIYNIVEYEDIRNYLLEINNFLGEIENKVLNKNICCNSITLQYENAIKGSTEDGIAFANFVKKMDSILFSNKELFPYLAHRFKNGAATHLLGGFIQPISRILRNENNNLEQLIDKILKKEIINETLFCGAMLYTLKIMYDGTILTCQNSMFDAYYLPEKPKSNSVEDQSRHSYILHNQRVNLFTSTDKEINQYIDYNDKHLNGGNLLFMINTIANLLFLMSLNGQVDISYSRNLQKTYKHAFLLANLNCCFYNLLIFSGSSLIRNTGEIRFLCNGVMDMIEDNIENELLEVRKVSINGN